MLIITTVNTCSNRFTNMHAHH